MRGIILEGFLNKYKTSTAIIASALIFGVIHLNIPQFVTATFIGLIFGIIYYKTRSLILCITAHMLYNTLVTISEYINLLPKSINFFIGIVTFVIAIKVFNKEFSAKIQEPEIIDIK